MEYQATTLGYGAASRLLAESDASVQQSLELDRIYDRLDAICQGLFGATMSLDNTAHAIFGGVASKPANECSPVPEGALAKIHDRIDILANLAGDTQNLANRYSGLAA